MYIIYYVVPFEFIFLLNRIDYYKTIQYLCTIMLYNNINNNMLYYGNAIMVLFNISVNKLFYNII